MLVRVLTCFTHSDLFFLFCIFCVLFSLQPQTLWHFSHSPRQLVDKSDLQQCIRKADKICTKYSSTCFLSRVFRHSIPPDEPCARAHLPLSAKPLLSPLSSHFLAVKLGPLEGRWWVTSVPSRGQPFLPTCSWRGSPLESCSRRSSPSALRRRSRPS